MSETVFTLIDHFELSQKSPIFFGYFCYQICCQELSKIAQSGHTALNPTSLASHLQFSDDFV